MQAFVALLRGINVGRANRVPMAELRNLLEDLGYSHVSTLLNSGNAIFCTPGKVEAEIGPAISRALEARLGISVPVIVRSRDQILATVQANPIGGSVDPSRLLVLFASQPRELELLQPLEALLLPNEQFHITPSAAFLSCPHGILESKAAAALAKLGLQCTSRNWATVLKIADRLSGMPLDASPKPARVRGAA